MKTPQNVRTLAIRVEPTGIALDSDNGQVQTERTEATGMSSMRSDTQEMTRSNDTLHSLRAALAAVATMIACCLPLRLAAQMPDSAAIAARSDRVMSVAAAATGAGKAPGCAVGIAQGGRPVYERAFGMADLEFGIANTPQTIFESGSVAKQFTAASIVLLALEGKLRLDDPVKEYIPELPDYGAPLTIRHLLNHTSGIRDWGSVLELTGFGRGDRVISQALALDVIVHQRGLDFTPGAEYSYSNSGFTLLSTIVERVSGQRLPMFTTERFFKPLAMTHTQWRDDYTRLVPGRAQAYTPAAPETVSMTAVELEKRVGLWRNVATHLPAQTLMENGALRMVGGAVLHPLRDGGYLAAQGPIRWQFDVGPDGKPAKATRFVPDGEEHFVIETPWTPTAAQLAEFSGVWHSDEADATFTFAVRDGQPALEQRPARRLPLRSLYRDHFGTRQGGGQVIWFTRDGGGRVTTMHIGASRMRDMPFVREETEGRRSRNDGR